MIIGDPFNFAIQFDVVKNWNAQGDLWRNGVFRMYLNGGVVFDFLDVVELRTTVGFYSKLPFKLLSPNERFGNARTLFCESNDYFVGDGVSLNSAICDLACTAMGGRECYVYYEACLENDRFIWSVDGGVTVSDALLPLGTLEKVIGEISKVDLSNGVFN